MLAQWLVDSLTALKLVSIPGKGAIGEEEMFLVGHWVVCKNSQCLHESHDVTNSELEVCRFLPMPVGGPLKWTDVCKNGAVSGLIVLICGRSEGGEVEAMLVRLKQKKNTMTVARKSICGRQSHIVGPGGHQLEVVAKYQSDCLAGNL